AKKYNMIEDDGNYYELYNNNGVIHVLMSLLDDKFRDMSNFAYPQLVTDSRKLIKE
ncbi:MAG: hypothetical protein QOF61_1449, partial [Acidobacteriota bacterium]|nr:hypothetical protein [Acidobacteriota bacterium]